MLLLLLFIAVPLIEIALFIQLGSILDLGWILLIVVLTAILGTWLVRQQGRGVLRQLQASMQDLQDPTEPLVHGAMILFSGALLLTPGFFTDAIGFLLLVPAVRVMAFRWLRARVLAGDIRMQGSVHAGMRRHPGSSRPQRGDGVIDAEYEDVTTDDASSPAESDGISRRPSGWTRPD
jgi:UPF0716 protein FxsA